MDPGRSPLSLEAHLPYERDEAGLGAQGIETRVDPEPHERRVVLFERPLEPFERGFALAEAGVDGREPPRRHVLPVAPPLQLVQDGQGFVPAAPAAQAFARPIDGSAIELPASAMARS